MNNLNNIFAKNSNLVADGAMGTLIIDRTQSSKSPTLQLRDDPDLIVRLHEEYITAGAILIQTFTFGTNLVALKKMNLEHEFDALNKTAVACAQKAIGNRPIKLVGNIGSVGLSPTEFQVHKEIVRKSIKQQMMILIDSGVDVVSFETITSLSELELVLEILAKQHSFQSLVSLTPDANLKLHDGTEFDTWFESLNSSNVSACGLNCVHDMQAIKQFMRCANHTTKPISIRASAGIPFSRDGQWIYPVDENAYSIQLEASGAFRANLIGGCCGTTPSYIRKIKSQLS